MSNEYHEKEFYQCEVCCEITNDFRFLFRKEEQVKQHIKETHTFDELLQYIMEYTTSINYSPEEIKENKFTIVEDVKNES